MQATESMDLKHSDTLDSVVDEYIPNSKSTDLIKPTKLDNQQPSGECGWRKKPSRLLLTLRENFMQINIQKAFRGNEKKSLFYLLLNLRLGRFELQTYLQNFNEIE